MPIELLAGEASERPSNEAEGTCEIAHRPDSAAEPPQTEPQSLRKNVAALRDRSKARRHPAELLDAVLALLTGRFSRNSGGEPANM
ncbi:MAG TPA: hypothetical protein VHX65_20360 [Pirellulales bacterium]|jgi:hypothetical protein|nr:hypothetical protein [Pirellulales bacterium]